MGRDGSESVSGGLSGIRSDFAHFCSVHRAAGWRARLRVLLVSRAFWGLALYRLGRRVYALPRGPITLPLRFIYGFLFEIVPRATKTSFSVRSQIDSEVWVAPHGEVFVSHGARIGRGSMLHGGNTVGVGGRASNRGHPRLGERVTMCPGA